MNSPKSDKELDEWLELLSSSTHSPQGKFSAEKSYNILQQRLQPAYRKHKILSIRYTVAVAAGFVLLIGFGWMFYFYLTSRYIFDIRSIGTPSRYILRSRFIFHITLSFGIVFLGNLRSDV